jgi:hypothetical protein
MRRLGLVVFFIAITLLCFVLGYKPVTSFDFSDIFKNKWGDYQYVWLVISVFVGIAGSMVLKILTEEHNG